MFDDDLIPAEDVRDGDLPAPVPAGCPVVGVGDLHRAEPGADLAWLLETGLTGDVDDATLVEAVAAWQRMASWAAAGAARTAARLAERPSMNPTWPATAGNVSEPNVTGEELAMRLACSRRAARTLVRHGRAYAGALSMTGAALARGDIDPTKARLLVEALDRPEIPVPLALDVQDTVLPGAAGWTPTQLARQVAAALITADPTGATARHDAARRGRRIDHPRALPDGMAGIWAVLDATDAIRLDTHIDTLARVLRNDGDPRTIDQLRADILIDLTDGSTLQTPAADIGTEPADDADAREPVDNATTSTDPASPTTRTDPGGPTAPTGPATEADQASPPAPADRPHRSRRSARSQIRVTVPLSSLIDPTSGAVLDVGRTRYRPPTDLADHIRMRDRTCARPGCPTDADTCQLDHTVEYHRDGGTTSHDSMSPLCQRDHTIKTDGGFHLTQTRPGVLRWTTPTGHTYTVQPGTSTPYQHEPPRQDPPDRRARPRAEDPPPF